MVILYSQSNIGVFFQGNSPNTYDVQLIEVKVPLEEVKFMNSSHSDMKSVAKQRM